MAKNISENNKKKMTKGTLAMLITLAVFVLILLLMLILRTNRRVCEFICRYFVNAYQAVAGRFFSVTSVNIFELLAALAVLLAIGLITASIILFCKRKRIASRRVLLALILICVGIANLYTFTAGFAYNRDAAPIDVYKGDISKEVALESFIILIDDLNESYAQIGNYNDDGSVVCPYSEKQLNEKIRRAVDELLNDKYYYSYTPKAKPVISSGIMTLNRIAGITFLPTCEPGYNKDMLIVDRVHTIAHEFAHTKGIMREYEANLAATYVLLNSGDAFLKYCGYIYASSFVDELIKYDETYFDNINAYPVVDGFLQDDRLIFIWWWNQPSLGNIGSFFNDLYLKINGQHEGTGSYEETPGTDEIIIGGEEDEPDRYLQIITEYTNMHTMLVQYAQSIKGQRALSK